MSNALFLDYAILGRESDLRSTSVSGEAVVLRLAHDAAETHRERMRRFFDVFVKLNSSDLRAIEAVASRLVNAEADEAGKTIEQLLAEDNRRARDRFVAELLPLRKDDVLRLASAVEPDGEAALKRWIDAGEILSVVHHGTTFFPAFAFRDGRPNPVVKDILDVLRPELSAWQRAFWFVSANGWLSGKAPADMLDQPERVMDAARQELKPLVG